MRIYGGIITTGYLLNNTVRFLIFNECVRTKTKEEEEKKKECKIELIENR